MLEGYGNGLWVCGVVGILNCEGHAELAVEVGVIKGRVVPYAAEVVEIGEQDDEDMGGDVEVVGWGCDGNEGVVVTEELGFVAPGDNGDRAFDGDMVY